MELAILIALVGLIAYQQVMLVVQTRRHDEDVRRLLERIHTSPRIEVVPLEVQVTPQVPAPQKLYISDAPYDDQHWNDTVAPERKDDEE